MNLKNQTTSNHCILIVVKYLTLDQQMTRQYYRVVHEKEVEMFLMIKIKVKIGQENVSEKNRSTTAQKENLINLDRVQTLRHRIILQRQLQILIVKNIKTVLLDALRGKSQIDINIKEVDQELTKALTESI